jgi:hypothetical protein
MGSLRTIRTESALESKMWVGGPFLTIGEFLQNKNCCPVIDEETEIFQDVVIALVCSEVGSVYSIPHYPYEHSERVISVSLLYKIYTILENTHILDQMFVAGSVVSLAVYGMGPQVYSIVRSWLRTIPYFASIETEDESLFGMKIGERIRLFYTNQVTELLVVNLFAVVDYWKETPSAIRHRISSRHKDSNYPLFPLYIKVTT